jgi:hypothetical protein
MLEQSRLNCHWDADSDTVAPSARSLFYLINRCRYLLAEPGTIPGLLQVLSRQPNFSWISCCRWPGSAPALRCPTFPFFRGGEEPGPHYEDSGALGDEAAEAILEALETCLPISERTLSNPLPDPSELVRKLESRWA